MFLLSVLFFFFFNDTATTEIYTLSLHDALPIYRRRHHLGLVRVRSAAQSVLLRHWQPLDVEPVTAARDRKSTRLNSSHPSISYAVFCLKKKKKNNKNMQLNNDQSQS